MRCDYLIARFAYIISSSFRPYSSFLNILEVNLSHVHLRCEMGPRGGQHVRRRCEETMTREHQQRRGPIPKRALNPTCAASQTVHLAVWDYRLELPMIWGRLPVALKRHTNEYLFRGCTNGVFHNTGNTASTTPTLHETRTETDKDDSTPRWAGCECVK